jgi:hypothetical protein
VAKQHRVQKLEPGDHQVGYGEKPRNADITAKETENPSISTKEAHLPIPVRGRMPPVFT